MYNIKTKSFFMKTIYKFILFFLCFSLFSQEDNGLFLKVVEIKGNVEIKKEDSDWMKVTLGEAIEKKCEIRTGFHSQITLEAERNCYITINQLSEVIVNDIIYLEKGKKKSNEEEKSNLKKRYEIKFFISRGYVICYSKKMKDLVDKKVIIQFKNGEAHFINSSGDLYYRTDNGALIRSWRGRVLLFARLNKLSFIDKKEMALITPNGKLFENEYFLKRELNIKPTDVFLETDIEAYYNRLTLPYTIRKNSNDYYDNFYP